MAKNSIDVYGASGKTNVLNFEPENLHLVTDKTHPLYDERTPAYRGRDGTEHCGAGCTGADHRLERP
jgi:hypothetical protein